MAWVTSTSQFWRPDVQGQGVSRPDPCTICSRESVLYIILGFWWPAGNFGVSWLIEALPQSLYIYVCVHTHTHTHIQYLVQMVKNLPAVQETQVWSLGLEDPLEMGMATHSNILVWRIPWTEEPGGLSPWGHKESHATERLTLSLFTPYLVFLLVFIYFFYLAAWGLSCSMWHLCCNMKELSL